MLPFLKNKQEASVSAPVESVERKPDEDKDYDSLHVCMQEFNAASKKDDFEGMAAAMKAAFEICDSEPHHEGEHV